MTFVRAAALLDRLSGGVVPVDGDVVAVHDFGDALAWARSQRDHGVTFSPRVDRTALALEDIERITHAGEDAARLGIERALIDLGGTLVRLDVPNRRVEAQIVSRGPVIERGIDAFVRPARGNQESLGEDEVGDAGDGVSPATNLETGASGPARVVRNASLVSTLAGGIAANG